MGPANRPGRHRNAGIRSLRGMTADLIGGGARVRWSAAGNSPLRTALPADIPAGDVAVGAGLFP
jgi:hypothetical protein